MEILRIFLIEIILMIQCAWPHPSLSRQKRIVGGIPLREGEFPWMVSFHFKLETKFTKNSGMKHLCGGTLIQPLWVLSAAHCFSNLVMDGLREKDNWDVVVGEHNQFRTDKNEKVLKIDQIFIHKNFTVVPLHHDIALIKLKAVDGIEGQPCIELDKQGEFNPDDECTVAGWGQISNIPYGWGMYIPLKTTVNIISNEQCRQAYSNVNNNEIQVEPFILCTGSDTDHDACSGDSGGPLVCRTKGDYNQLRIAGVVSTGQGCGDSRYPGIYTRVSWYGDWIEKVMNGNSTGLVQVKALNRFEQLMMDIFGELANLV